MNNAGGAQRFVELDHSNEAFNRFSNRAPNLEAEDHRAREAFERIMGEITRLDLEKNIGQLAMYGYTVIEPERVAPASLIKDLRDKVLEVGHRRSGVKPDLVTGEGHAGLESPAGQMMMCMLLEDRVFEQALMNEVSVALVNYLLGEGSLLSSSRAFLKGRGTMPLNIHCDYPAPAPFPLYPSMCNVTWALTDYSKENGSIGFVPGGHKYGRRPRGDEGVSQLIGVDAPAGSLIVFDAYMWHGAFPRHADGLRVSLTNIFCRPYLYAIEGYRDHVPKEVLARNSKRFATFVGEDIAFEGGPDVDINKYRALLTACQNIY